MTKAFTTFWIKKSTYSLNTDAPFFADVDGYGKINYVIRTEGDDENSSRDPKILRGRRDFQQLVELLTVPTYRITKLGSNADLFHVYNKRPEGMYGDGTKVPQKNPC